MIKGKIVKKLPAGRRIAVGDIHGCFKTFHKLVEEVIALTKSDQLFLLGDYIDKGKRNKEVLDYILHLIREGYLLYPLMGNHEYFTIRDLEFQKEHNYRHQLKDLISSKDIINAEGEIYPSYMRFIHKLPYFYELDDFILVHAGLDFEREHPLEDTYSMIYARGYQVDKQKIKHKTLVHGHTPISFETIQQQIESYKTVGEINLDNGCVYKDDLSKKGRGLGRLCALDLDRMHLFSLENID